MSKSRMKDRPTPAEVEDLSPKWNDALKVWMPRKLMTLPDNRMIPMVVAGRAIYALPGGKDYIA